MSISGKTSTFHVGAFYNGYDEKGLSFVAQDKPSNEQLTSDFDLKRSLNLPDDPQHAKSTNWLSSSRLSILFALATAFSSIGYIYQNHLSEARFVLKNMLHTLTTIESSAQLKQFNYRIIHTVDEIFQRHQLSTSSAELKRSLQDVQNESISSELEKIGNRCILTDRWQADDIDQFLALWDMSDENSRIKTTQSIWFQQFTFKLGHHANKLLVANIKNDPNIILARKLSMAN